MVTYKVGKWFFDIFVAIWTLERLNLGPFTPCSGSSAPGFFNRSRPGARTRRTGADPAQTRRTGADPERTRSTPIHFWVTYLFCLKWLKVTANHQNFINIPQRTCVPLLKLHLIDFFFRCFQELKKMESQISFSQSKSLKRAKISNAPVIYVV